MVVEAVCKRKIIPIVECNGLMECISERYSSPPLKIYTTNKSKSNGVNEEEEPLNTRSHKDPVSHDATTSLAMGVQI